MSAPRIALIGAGSLKFTFQIVDSLIQSEILRDAEIVLFDIDVNRLNLVSQYVREQIRRSRASLTLHTAENRDLALEGADYVLVTVAIGGLALKRMDIDLAMEFGIVQVKGDTHGPAGIFRALRSVPFFLQLVSDMKRLCPKAFMINLTNPMAVITRAVVQAGGIRAAGLCTSVAAMSESFAQILGVERQRLHLVAAGLNHFTWLIDLLIDGHSHKELIRDKIVPAFGDLPVTRELFELYGMFPIPGYKYASEFVPYYLIRNRDNGLPPGFVPFDGIAEQQSFHQTVQQVQAEISGQQAFSMAHANEDSQAVIELMESLYADQPAIHMLNVENQGQLPNLPAGALVECPVHVRGEQLAPLLTGPMTAPVNEMLRRAESEQAMILQAAMTGDRSMLLAAIALDPLIPSPAVAKKLMDRALFMQREYLPIFQ